MTEMHEDVWAIPKIQHDNARDVGPRIHGGWIHRSAGQSDPEHTRLYAALLLAAADEAERSTADAQHEPITNRETDVSDPTSNSQTTEGVPTMAEADRTEIRKLALNLAREVTVAVVATRALEGDAGEHTLRNADRFAKWLETGQIPTQP